MAMQLRVAAVALLAVQAGAFSTFAGSCKHAGVNHGLDKFAAQECVTACVPLSTVADWAGRNC
jgi:hypothetical protein